MFYHFLAPEGRHPTWEEHFIENISKCRVLFLSYTCKLNQQKQWYVVSKVQQIYTRLIYMMFTECLLLTNHEHFTTEILC